MDGGDLPRKPLAKFGSPGRFTPVWEDFQVDARPPVEAQARSTSVAFVKDPAGRDRYVNRHFLELFGDP